MNEIRTQENTPRVLAAAAVFFGGLVALGVAGGVFERLGPELTLTLAAFSIAFALLTYALDAGVRGMVNRLLRLRGAARASARAAELR